MKRLAWPVLVALCVGVPAMARAADGYVVDNVNLRAGPDPSYPLIDQLQAGTEVDVQGCTDGYEWCDVIAYGNRGWIAGNYIQYQYKDQEVILPSYGAQIGIPIVAFSIGTYWDSYYRSRPFYSDRGSWYSRPYVRRPPPPPPREFYPGRPGYGRPDGHGDWHDNDGGRGHDDSGYRPGQGYQWPGQGQGFPRPGDNQGQGFQRPGQSDGRGNDGNHGYRPGQGNQRPSQPAQHAQGEGYQRPGSGGQGQGYQLPGQPAQPGPANAPRPMPAPGQMGRPLGAQPAPAGNQTQPNGRQRPRDSDPREDAAPRNKGR